MTYVINSYLRRHDTYHSWFEFAEGDDASDRVIRHTVANPPTSRSWRPNTGR